MSDTTLTQEDLAHLSTIGWSSEQEKQAFAAAKAHWLELLSQSQPSYREGYLKDGNRGLYRMATLEAMSLLGRHIQPTETNKSIE